MTIEQKNQLFIEKARQIYGDKYNFSSTIFVRNKEKISVICKIHGLFFQWPEHFLKGHGCQKCSGKYRLNTKEFIEKAKQIHGDKYDYSKSNYISMNAEVSIICKKHGIFNQSPAHHIKRKQGCSKCSKNYKSSTKEFIEKAKQVHGERYDYSLVDYKNKDKKIIIMCRIHGKFEQTPGHHLYGHGCSRCSKNCKRTTAEFIEQSRKIYGDKYEYFLGKKLDKKVKMCCKLHKNEFKQCVSDHLLGHEGCEKCRGKITNTEEFIEKAKKIHVNRYDYSKTVYINSNIKVKIGCLIHGDFMQYPAHHIQGHGCGRCNGAYKKTQYEFIEQAKKVHKDKYVYDFVNYKNSTTDIEITCRKHGNFWQRPEHHLRGSGCPKCSRENNLSRNEKYCAETLKKLYPQYEIITGDRTVLKGKSYKGSSLEIDIIIQNKTTNDHILYIEWNGAHWHEQERAIINDDIKKKILGKKLLVIKDYGNFDANFVEKMINKKIIPKLNKLIKSI